MTTPGTKKPLNNLFILIALAVIMKHHSNIARLARGTERRMGERKDQ